MYENLLYQNTTEILIRDITKDCLPGAILFSGPEASGKLTAALETARILSCTGEKKGSWLCNCASCLKHKVMADQNIILVGPRNCSLEIAASKDTFLRELETNSTHVRSTRYLFIRSVKKLTLRFREVLWQNDEKIGKISVILEPINDDLEILDPCRELPKYETVLKICNRIQKNCKKLEDTFMYDSLPVQQIRNVSLWARMKTKSGKKVIIIENADQMLESVRNALLKILEEPPEDAVFILTTKCRGAVMPTILSRVRTYTFKERSFEQQQNVIDRVFHQISQQKNIDSYLKTFLSVSPSIVIKNAKEFYNKIIQGSLPNVSKIVKECDYFSPHLLLKIFLQGIIDEQKKLLQSSVGVEASSRILQELQICWSNITTYNESPAAGIEILVRSLALINKQYGGLS